LPHSILIKSNLSNLSNQNDKINSLSIRGLINIIKFVIENKYK